MKFRFELCMTYQPNEKRGAVVETIVEARNYKEAAKIADKCAQDMRNYLRRELNEPVGYIVFQGEAIQ